MIAPNASAGKGFMRNKGFIRGKCVARLGQSCGRFYAVRPASRLR